MFWLLSQLYGFWTRLKHNEHAKSATIALSVSIPIVSRGCNSHCIKATASFINIRVLALHNNPHLEMYKECCIPNTKQMATLESYSIRRSHACQMEQDTHPPVRTTLKKQEQTTSSIWHTKFQFNIITAFCCQCVCVSVFRWYPKTYVPFLSRQKDEWKNKDCLHLINSSILPIKLNAYTRLAPRHLIECFIKNNRICTLLL
jgi:hypothetical protein